MHALELADALHIGCVLIPRYPGVLSALGLTLADFVKDYSQTVMQRLDQVDAAALERGFAPLWARGLHELTAEGFQAQEIRFERALDIRYHGQSFELTIPLDASDPAEAAARFLAAHQQRYGYARPGQPLELVNLRLSARGLRPPSPEEAAPQGEAPLERRDPPAPAAQVEISFETGALPAAMVERSSLFPGHVLAGPALVVQPDATTVVPPGWQAQVDGWLNLIFTRSPVAR